MKAVVVAFNQEEALVGAFSVITNLLMELFEALVRNLRINYNKLLIVTLLVSRIRCGVRLQINLIRARCLSISGPMQCQSDQQAPLSTRIKTVKSLHCQLTADTFDCFGFYVNV